jgi:hypothetical protein
VYWLGYLTIFSVGLGIATAAFALNRKMLSARGRIAHLLENITIILVAVFLTFMALEVGFKLFFAQSDGFRYTLASQNWYDRYWVQNSLGYRDKEWTPEEVAGKTRVMVVGDSVAAGSGIANQEDRFANRLGQYLGDDYAVMVVASPGWDTLDEIEAIIEYPHAPDMLVLSYFINDIEGSAYAQGAQRPQIRQDPPNWFKPLVDNSYVFNFLYWRLVRLGPQEWATTYWEDWLKKISADPDIRWRHQQELLRIIDGAVSEGIPLFVVVFPNLAAVEESQFLVQPVIELFESRGVPVVDVSRIVANRDPAQITVNAVDAHPNEAIHAKVAEKLYSIILDYCTLTTCDNPRARQSSP